MEATTETSTETTSRIRIGRWIRIVALSGAAITLLAAILATDLHPRTDDASVRANFIEVTAEVSGKLTSLPVKDNAFVKKGALLFEIDPRPYQYALQQALSDQEALEQQIVDAKRKIASQKSAVQAATAAEVNSKTEIKTAGSGVDVASAAINRAKANVAAAEAQLTYATNNLHRVQPLLEKSTSRSIKWIKPTRRYAQPRGITTKRRPHFVKRKLSTINRYCAAWKRIPRPWNRQPGSVRRSTT